MRFKLWLWVSLALAGTALQSLAAPTFPAWISGLQLHLEADAGVALNGSAVSAWSDQTSNGYNASMGTAANQPLYVAGTSTNGLYGAIRFDGSRDSNGDYLSNGGASMPAGAMTTFIVYAPQVNPKTGNSAGTEQIPFDWGQIGGGRLRALYLYGTTSPINGGFVGYGADAGAGKFTVTAGQQYLTTFRMQDLNSLQEYNRGTGDSSSTLAYNQTSGMGFGNPGVNGYTIGGTPIPTTYNYPYKGDILAILVYNSSLSDTDRKTVDQYLYDKYFSTPLAQQAPTVSASGGTVINYTDAGGTNWIAHIFSNVGDSTLTVTAGGSVEVLVVAGGGGGGSGATAANNGGGGGAGGLIHTSDLTLGAGSVGITVGAGGGADANGADSVFSSSAVVLRALGGGRGSGGSANFAGPGGSGGGGSPYSLPAYIAGANGTAGQGNKGGTSANGSDTYTWRSGGGGGAGGAGNDGAANGNGGAGLQYALSGTAAWYAGGGGGSGDTGGGLGGSGVGGIGATNLGQQGYATAGAANTGSGGGGGNSMNTPFSTEPGAAGGSGIVIVRYLGASSGTPTVANLTPTNVTTSGASLNGFLSSIGASDTAMFVYWGTADGGTNSGPVYWANTNSWAAPQSPGSFTANATGLSSNTTYYYRFAASNAAGRVWAPAPAIFMTSPIGVDVTANASESGLIPGTFTIRRPVTTTNEAVTVNYTISGTATAGVDYVNNLGTSITIPAGASNVTLTVTPINDWANQSDTTVVLTPTTGAYADSTANGATMTIANRAYASAPTNTWLGSGSASSAGNWSLGIPTSAQDILLEGGISSGNMTWDATNTVHSWTQTSNYTGTVTFNTVYGSSGLTNFTITGDATINGGTWTHIVNSGGETYRLNVSVNGSLFISNATISADALGYVPWSGLGWSGVFPSGGTYGGAGGGNGSPNVYGSIQAPVNLGGSGYAVPGGGAILLNVTGTTTIAATGIISANGGVDGRGCGAGGSVYLTTGWLNGSGTIRANGGAAGSDGGGGRVAIILTGLNANFDAWLGANTAYGGAYQSYGAAGTVYRKTAAGVDTLIVDNNGMAAPESTMTRMPNGVNLNAFSNVVINHMGVLGVVGDTTLDLGTFNPTTYGAAQSALAIINDTCVTYPSDWTIAGYTLRGEGITKTLGNVTVGNNGVLTHCANTSSESYKLNLTLAGNLTVLANGAISAYAKGYQPYAGPGWNWGLLWFGGPYGGGGGGGNQNTYGLILSPANIGASGYFGPGGGAILLNVAGITTVATGGSISANGGIDGRGSGSGGSVYLITGSLTGGGTIGANGGAAGNGDGGGGRVAIILRSGDFTTWTGANTAYGGAAQTYGAAGTVYRVPGGASANAGTVMVDNNNKAANGFASLPGFAGSTENLKQTQWVVQNRGRVALLTNLPVKALTLAANTSLELGGHTLTVDALTVTNTSFHSGSYTVNDSPLFTDAIGGGKVVVNAHGTVAFFQ